MLRTGAALLALVIVGGCGSSVASNKPGPAERYLVYEKTAGEKGIWVAEVDGSHPRLLAPDGQLPVISPDGKQVAYAVDCYTSDASDCDKAFVVSTEPGAKSRLLAERIGWRKTWSPDSKAIVSTRSLSEPVEALVRIDVTTGEETTLARGHFWGWSFSPDGRRIVFALAHGDDPGAVTGERIDLYVTDLDGQGDASPLTNTGDSMYPVWGPDSIAFGKEVSCFGPSGGLRPLREAARDGCFHDTWGRGEIWRIQPDGTGRAPITETLPKRFQSQGCVGLKPVEWSEDGRALLGAWWCEFSDAPVAVDPKTSTIRDLGRAASTVGLSRDGRFALVHEDTGPETPPEKNSVLIVPYAGGTPKMVASGATAPDWNR